MNLPKLFLKYQGLLQGTSHKATLFKGGLGSLSVQILGTGIGFVVHIGLARCMGTMQFGIFVYVFTWLQILALLGSLGLDTVLLRFVAAYYATRDWNALRGLLIQSTRIGLTVSIVLSALIALILSFLKNHLQSELHLTFLIGCLILPFLILTGFRMAVLRGLKHVVYASLPETIIRPLLLIVVILLIWHVRPHWLVASTAMLLNGLALVVAFVIGAFWLHQRLPEELQNNLRPHFHTREWLIVALPMMLSSGIQIIQNRTDIIMVGSLLGSDAAGIYSAATRLSGLLLFGIASVNTIAAPMISQLYATGKQHELQHTMTLAVQGIFFFTAPVALVLIFSGKLLLSLFGPDFIVGYATILILISGHLVNAFVGSVGFLLVMTGHQNYATMILGGSAGANIILNFLLIPHFGISGAAMATAITTVLWKLLMSVYVRKHLQIDPTLFSVLRKTS